MENKKKNIGKGIRALLGNIETAVNTPEHTRTVTQGETAIREVPLSAIHVNPFQPRKDFQEEALQELSHSIKVHGLIQPITLRKLDADTYQLISGERRFRASQLAGLTALPAYVRTANDQEMLEMALIENIQREDLNAIEVAISYQRLIEECQLTHEQMSERVAKNRSTITNYIRLLKLPPEIQHTLKTNRISMGHARALLGVQDIALQLMIHKRLIEEGLSVRAVEQLIQQAQQATPHKAKPAVGSLDATYRGINDKLNQFFQQKVGLKVQGNGKGQITINFNSDDELNRILEACQIV